VRSTNHLAPRYAVSSGLIGTASHPDKQKIPIIGFFLENKLHVESEVGKKFIQTAVLFYIFMYVSIKH